MTFTWVIAIAIILWIFTYSVSFGIWTWKRKNRLGAIMVFALAITELCMPLYVMFFRR